MEEERGPQLIVGLGNPGKEYEKTRHNLGALVVRAFAEKWDFHFQKEKKIIGELAQGTFHQQKIMLLLPLTYMNRSGEAVRLCMAYYKIDLSNLLIVVDDVALPLGKYRLRLLGSSGGHNGLKSIEQHLQTQDYARLRVGISRQEGEDLADYVLSYFNMEEQKGLPSILIEGIQYLDTWLLREGE